jgi:hypothetical protein
VIRLLVALVAVPTVLSLAPALPIPKGDDKAVLYFPTQVGAKWVWVMQTDGGRYEFTETVAGVAEKDGEKVVTIRATSQYFSGGVWKEAVYTSQVVGVSSRGLFYSRDGIRNPSPPLCRLKLPHVAGNRWDYRSTSPVLFAQPETIAGTMTAHGPELVEVPAGKYLAIRVEMKDVGEKFVGETSWFAPRVGLVKSVIHRPNYSFSTVLKSFTPGKD